MTIDQIYSTGKQLNVLIGTDQAHSWTAQETLTSLKSENGSAVQDALAQLKTAAPLDNTGLSSLQGYQSGYSVEDAAASLWMQQNGVISLNDPSTLTRLRSGHTSLSPTQEELSDFVGQLRENGLDGSVNWSRLTTELNSLQNTQVTDLSDQVDYLASRYVAVLDKLERNYSGTELNTQKARLEQVWQSAAQGVTGNYTQYLQDNLGLSDQDASQIQGSLDQILRQRVRTIRGPWPRSTTPWPIPGRTACGWSIRTPMSPPDCGKPKAPSLPRAPIPSRI